MDTAVQFLQGTTLCLRHRVRMDTATLIEKRDRKKRRWYQDVPGGLGFHPISEHVQYSK